MNFKYMFSTLSISYRASGTGPLEGKHDSNYTTRNHYPSLSEMIAKIPRRAEKMPTSHGSFHRPFRFIRPNNIVQDTKEEEAAGHDLTKARWAFIDIYAEVANSAV